MACAQSVSYIYAVASVLILLPVVLLLLPVLAIFMNLGLRRAPSIWLRRWTRPGRAVAWVSATLGALLGWAVALALAPAGPLRLALPSWQPAALLTTSPVLLLDSVSWPILIVLLGLNLAAALTQAVYSQGEQADAGSGLSLAAGSAISAAAVFGVLSANLPTLLLAWMLSDLLESLVWLLLAQENRHNQAIAIELLVRWAALGVAGYGGMRAAGFGEGLGFDPPAEAMRTALVLAAGLRLGVLPLRASGLSGIASSPSLGALLALASPASSLALLARLAQGGPLIEWQGVVLMMAAAAALVGALAWLSRPAPALYWWLSAAGGMAVSAAALGRPNAALAWGMTLLSVGGVLGLAKIGSRAARGVLLGFAFSSAALPFTPTWPAAAMAERPWQLVLPILLAAHGVLLVGIIRQGLRPTPIPPQPERWVYLIYPLGLVWVLASWWLAAWMPASRLLSVNPANWPGALASLLALVGPGVGFGLLPLLQRRRRQASRGAARRSSGGSARARTRPPGVELPPGPQGAGAQRAPSLAHPPGEARPSIAAQSVGEPPTAAQGAAPDGPSASPKRPSRSAPLAARHERAQRLPAARRAGRRLLAALRLLPPDWFDRLASRTFHALAPLAAMVERVLEGQAGLLWALVILALLISLLAQLVGG